ncbi:hypothetical protein LR48_Vigan04g011400 [Vigna angularis]|uniref:Uncharacterized protein n=1 Tax=Phaseolus angularis TaxID=3914 RepID=A0A0L9UB31_PHAAN|nr:hypothetical protein LR48_Vigan04g011400 [Vigna angularis]
MGISPVPFFAQEDYSHFYNLFADTDTNKRKRNSKEDEGGGAEQNGDSGIVKDLLASLMLLEEEETREQQNRMLESQQQRDIGFMDYCYHVLQVDATAFLFCCVTHL